MAHMEVKRDHEGKLHLFADEQPVIGAFVTGMKVTTEGMAFEVYLPLKSTSLGEVGKVIPFRTAA